MQYATKPHYVPLNVGLNKHMAMNPMGIGVVYSRRCQRGPNVRDILPERGKFGRAYEFDRNDVSDRYLQKFGNSVLSMVYHHGLLLVCVSFTIIGQPRNSVLIRRV